MGFFDVVTKVGTYGAGAVGAGQMAPKTREAAKSSAAAVESKQEGDVAQASQDVASLGSSATSATLAGVHGAEFAAGKGLLKFGAKAAARFAPGLNVAAAGWDNAEAAARWNNPKMSLSKKVSQSVVAAGSTAAATNIPGLSQVGAGVSAVANLVDIVL